MGRVCLFPIPEVRTVPDKAKWCAIDAEGDVGDKGLLGVSFYSDDVQCYETDHTRIYELILEHARNGYTFLAHNAAYDIPVIFWQLHIPMRTIEYNGRLNRGEWRYDKRKPMVQLWDTLALSGGISLAKLGKALGCPKYETPQRLLGIDPNKYNWMCDTHKVWECEECYAIRDAEIVYRFMCEFESLLAGWGVRPKRRLSAISMDVWKQLDSPQAIALTDGRISRLARNSYAGGRVETFKLGHIASAYSADVYSMYPSVMQSTRYPDPRTMHYVTNRKPATIEWSFEGVAEIDISVPPMYIPPLPYMHKGERMYPIGRLRGCWTFLEIRWAVQLGCRINHVHAAAYSTSFYYPFTTFISTLVELRNAYESKNDPRTIFAKLLMNNLYGRLGMRESTSKRTMQPAPDGTGSNDWRGYEWQMIGDRVYISSSDVSRYENTWSNVLWAAQTTAAARVKLHQLLLLQGGNAVYCDTDSVFSSAPIVGLADGLGNLRDEQSYNWIYVAQPKMYAYESANGEIGAKAKGVPRKLAYEFIQNGIVSFRHPVRPWEARRRGIRAGTWIWTTRERQAVPHRRSPVAPSALLVPHLASDTAPPVIGPCEAI